ncbi:MAG TPA: EVE domain-containing protein, partial [Saprospiraceae bacterium]|nr:EVE domain-containing protein [Saprospiraceae bacterium]
MEHWLIKSEPEEFSFEDLEREGTTEWTGVRNYAARINLNNMRNGDICLFYHSVTDKRIVGLATIVEEAYPD